MPAPRPWPNGGPNVPETGSPDHAERVAPRARKPAWLTAIVVVRCRGSGPPDWLPKPGVAGSSPVVRFFTNISGSAEPSSASAGGARRGNRFGLHALAYLVREIVGSEEQIGGDENQAGDRPDEPDADGVPSRVAEEP